MKDNKSLTA